MILLEDKMKTLASLFLLISFLLLSACNPASPISKAKSVALAGKQAWAMTIDSGVVQGMAVDNGIVYSGGRDLHATDPATGRSIWDAHFPYSTVVHPMVAHGMVYACNQTLSALYAFGTTNGQKRWSVHSDCSGGRMVVAGDVIYAGGKGYDAATGKQRWAATPKPRFSGSGAVADGLVYFHCVTNRLCAYDAVTGNRKWSVRAGSSIEDHFSVDSPVAADGMVYMYGGGGKMYAYDAVSGKRKWVASVESKFAVSSIPTVANGSIYISGDKLYALDAVSGKQKWALPMSTFNSRADAPPATFVTPSVVADGVLYTASPSGRLFALDAASGRQKWAAPFGDFTPFVAGDKVYVAGYESEPNRDIATLHAFYR
jgi:outer membrane protein assembly factor BamB